MSFNHHPAVYLFEQYPPFFYLRNRTYRADQSVWDIFAIAMEGKLNVIDAIYRRAKRVESDEYNYSEYDGNPILQSNTRSYPRPKNSVMIHLILFFLTLGFGNIIYYLCVRSGQKEWDRKYSSFQKGNKQPTHNRLKYPELKESDFEEVIEYQSNLMHQSLSVLRNKNSYILVLPVNAQLFEITLANARTLNTDVVEASHFHGCCAECAKRRGRWFSLTGKDTRFPLLDINYDCSCTGLDYDPVIPGVSVPEYGPSNERKYIIYFNRQMTDDRTQTELKTYNKTIEDFKTEFLRCTNSNNREIDFRIKVCTLIK